MERHPVDCIRNQRWISTQNPFQGSSWQKSQNKNVYQIWIPFYLMLYGSSANKAQRKVWMLAFPTLSHSSWSHTCEYDFQISAAASLERTRGRPSGVFREALFTGGGESNLQPSGGADRWVAPFNLPPYSEQTMVVVRAPNTNKYQQIQTNATKYKQISPNTNKTLNTNI